MIGRSIRFKVFAVPNAVILNLMRTWRHQIWTNGPHHETGATALPPATARKLPAPGAELNGRPNRIYANGVVLAHLGRTFVRG